MVSIGVSRFNVNISLTTEWHNANVNFYFTKRTLSLEALKQAIYIGYSSGFLSPLKYVALTIWRTLRFHFQLVHSETFLNGLASSSMDHWVSREDYTLSSHKFKCQTTVILSFLSLSRMNSTVILAHRNDTVTFLLCQFRVLTKQFQRYTINMKIKR